jgi:hypothetical protein
MTRLSSKCVRLAVLALPLLFAGCVQYQWVNPSRPTANLNSDSVSCEQRVASLYPTQNVMVQTGGGYYTSGYRNCYRTYYGTACDYVPGHYVPPSYGVTDANATQRQQSFNACLRSKGWDLVPAKTQ